MRPTPAMVAKGKPALWRVFDRNAASDSSDAVAEVAGTNDCVGADGSTGSDGCAASDDGARSDDSDGSDGAELVANDGVAVGGRVLGMGRTVAVLGIALGVEVVGADGADELWAVTATAHSVLG